MTTRDDVGPDTVPVADPGMVNTQFVDWIVNWGHIEGVLNLTLGTVNYACDPNDVTHVRVTSRMRMSIEFAERLHKALGSTLENAKSGDRKERDPIPNRLN